MFLDADLRNLTKEQLEERLKALRDQRRASYAAPKRKISAKREMLPGLEGVDDQIAAKILADLEAMIKADAQGDQNE